MMIHSTDACDRRTGHADGTREASQAERHADALGNLIDTGYLSPDGAAAANGARGLIYAILALRQTVASTTAGTARTIADLDATLGIITDVIVATVIDAPCDGEVAAANGSSRCSPKARAKQ
jgi:hypothetical protein